MKTFRPFIRFLFFAYVTTATVAEIWIRNLFEGEDLDRSMRIRKSWANRLMKGIGVRLTVKGSIPDQPCIVIANHRSYLDPILMLCHLNAFPVAKAELASWPVIGRGAKMAGILYLKRESAKSRAGALAKIQEVIERGYPVIIFPEGTTSALDGVLPFKKGVFLLAAKANITITPVAVLFKNKADYWVGREKFLQHAGRRFKEPFIEVCLHYGPILKSDDATVLLDQTQNWIEQHIVAAKNLPSNEATKNT
ncbi:MAG: 1-acyl-sn-glycerol-3-phosphate acyltransferase [Saprospiraceae bacterium]|nr:1-acyl-sn-glycerol-3-phosphate acyltransferase [Saprospiraceae bacterium]